MSAATEATFSSLGSWVASILVRLADLDLEYLPPVEPEGPLKGATVPEGRPEWCWHIPPVGP